MASLIERSRHYSHAAIVFIALVLFFIVLRELASLLLPLAFAIILSLLVSPFIAKLRKRGIPTILIIFGLVVVLLVLFSIFGFLFYLNSLTFIEKFPTYENNFNLELNKFVERLNLGNQNFVWSNFVSGDFLQSAAVNIINRSTEMLWNLVLVILYTSFILASRLTFFNNVGKAFSKEKAEKIRKIYNEVEKSVQTYLVTKILISLLTAVVSGIIMWIFGLDFIFILSTIIFFFNFIPNIGSIIATAFPIVLYLVKFGFGYQFVSVSILLILTQFVIGNILEPKWFGKGLNLSPLLILVGLVFWYWVWGVAGAVLAVPILSITKIIFEHIDSTKNVALFMGDNN